MEPVLVAWAKLPQGLDLSALTTAMQNQAQELAVRAAGHAHPTFRVSEDIIVELPPTTWGHGDLLIYLPHRHWLVRRHYIAAWYVDIGILTPFAADGYGWTDLWLDVITPDPASSYQLLDADEFASALRAGQVSPNVAALALDALHNLVTLIQAGQFPPPEVRQAELFARQVSVVSETPS